MTNWHVGMKCVAIADNWAGIEVGEVTPKVGPIYTVRAVDTHSGQIWLRFAEIKNGSVFRWPRNGGSGEIDFDAHNFRPVVSRPTSIAVFTAMLDPTRVREVVG